MRAKIKIQKSTNKCGFFIMMRLKDEGKSVVTVYLSAGLVAVMAVLPVVLVMVKLMLHATVQAPSGPGRAPRQPGAEWLQTLPAASPWLLPCSCWCAEPHPPPVTTKHILMCHLFSRLQFWMTPYIISNLNGHLYQPPMHDWKIQRANRIRNMSKMCECKWKEYVFMVEIISSLLWFFTHEFNLFCTKLDSCNTS